MFYNDKLELRLFTREPIITDINKVDKIIHVSYIDDNSYKIKLTKNSFIEKVRMLYLDTNIKKFQNDSTSPFSYANYYKNLSSATLKEIQKYRLQQAKLSLPKYKKFLTDLNTKLNNIENEKIIAYENIDKYVHNEIDKKDIESQFLLLLQKLLISVLLVTLAGVIISMIKQEVNTTNTLNTFDYLEEFKDFEKNNHIINQSIDIVTLSKDANKDTNLIKSNGLLKFINKDKSD